MLALMWFAGDQLGLVRGDEGVWLVMLAWAWAWVRMMQLLQWGGRWAGKLLLFLFPLGISSLLLPFFWLMEANDSFRRCCPTRHGNARSESLLGSPFLHAKRATILPGGSTIPLISIRPIPMLQSQPGPRSGARGDAVGDQVTLTALQLTQGVKVKLGCLPDSPQSSGRPAERPLQARDRRRPRLGREPCAAVGTFVSCLRNSPVQD